jgi:hypothetical protein
MGSGLMGVFNAFQGINQAALGKVLHKPSAQVGLDGFSKAISRNLCKPLI